MVLKVGDLQITQAAFEQYLADLEAQQGPADLSRKALGDNYASLLMLSRLAVANHLDTSPEVVRQLAIDRTQILSNAEFAKLKAQASPTEAEISAYYNAHLDDYDLVEMKRLFIWPGAAGSNNAQGLTAERAKTLADSIRQVYASGGDTARIQKLIHDTPHTSEEIVMDDQPLAFQRGELPAAMSDAAFSLKPGGWTELNSGSGGYVFITVVKRSRKDLKDVSAQIQKKLEAQKLRAELDALKNQSGIWMDETYFASKAPKPATTTDPEASGLSKSTTERGKK